MSKQEEKFQNFFNSDLIDDNFVNQIVKSKLDIPISSFKVKLVLITPATKPNENYLGLVCRLKIKIKLLESNKHDSIDVIVKVAQETIGTLSEMNVYQRENLMYDQVLKSFENIFLEKTGEKIQFGPKMLLFIYEPNPIIVLDDLKAQNYLMVDRIQGLSLELSKCFLIKLAKFHAAGAAKFQKEGILHESLDRNSTSAPKPDINDPLALTFVRIHEEFVRALKNYGDCDAYAEKLSRWNKEVIATGFMHECKKMKCGFQVLNHGDIWTNNMLFKFNPNEVLMIDYQLCFWGSPNYDLLAFLAASVSDEVKVKHFDELIEFYYQELSGTLVKIEYPNHIPSFDEFKEDIKDKGYMLAGFLSFLFFVKYSSPVEFSFDNLMTETNENAQRKVYDRLFTDEYFIKAVKVWLPFLEERGFLDALIIPQDVKVE